MLRHTESYAKANAGEGERVITERKTELSLKGSAAVLLTIYSFNRQELHMANKLYSVGLWGRSEDVEMKTDYLSLRDLHLEEEIDNPLNSVTTPEGPSWLARQYHMS
jgi:hypothetical protein